MKVEGACHCGYITYAATVDPTTVAICHCTDCQTLSGSAFRTFVPVGKGLFELRTGAPKTYVKRADSGRERVQAFCPECGTPIYSAAPTDTSFVVLRLGTIRERAQLRPRRQYWCRSALPWIMDLASVTQVSEQEGLAEVLAVAHGSE
jgi:hypothetical protein